DKLVGPRSQLGAYSAVGVGYRWQQGEEEPLGLLVMHYKEPNIAQADLQLRRSVAADGYSLTTGQEYRSTFRLQRAWESSSDLIFWTKMVDKRAGRWLTLAQQGDMAFAACP
ncbi:MAG: hypothetical protein M3014_05185, partial [Chloroflexota bacterium]|nr:hypothetical protein [Chloroflexota bacterium]